MPFFNGTHLIRLIIHSTLLYLIIVMLLLLYSQVFHRVQFLAIYFSPCILSLCQPLLTNTVSYTIHLLMTYNYRCMLPPDKISKLLHSMQSCLSDVKAWTTANILKLNDNETDLMLVTFKRTKHLYNLPTSITMGNAQIPFKQSVKNLGLTLDCHLTTNAHVSIIARTCYFELRRLASIRRFLTSTATAKHVSALILSRIDNCSSLLFDSTHDMTSHLQRIQNYAARLIFLLPRSSNITTH